MDDDELARRKGLTFEQAEGLAPLPRQLARTEISQELRAVLRGVIRGELEKSVQENKHGYGFSYPWSNVLRGLHVLYHPPDERFS